VGRGKKGPFLRSFPPQNARGRKNADRDGEGGDNRGSRNFDPGVHPRHELAEGESRKGGCEKGPLKGKGKRPGVKKRRDLKGGIVPSSGPLDRKR